MQGIEFKPDYVQHLPAGLTVEALVRQLARPLIADGQVVEDFADYVLAREETFPTGLPTEPVGVAIPHTDHRHVHHNAFGLGILPAPVSFADMAGEPDPVPVRVVFLLALSESNKQLNALGWIMELIQDSDFMQELLTMSDKAIYHAISDKMTERGEV
ncbi:PTS sugar transporter subunit IIA [Erwiniaceae bacterium BAC15a-03b]|uniref:PTS sugar transporter subunit IIA n=1 Tax=Winslowiella arboricola TaxID=2978220 RepID=A0A9J6PLG2_9GAMM|nr:PTS sugar transporter subunit IIA [Winslowiella arboricola]MCU5773499.1 PTS sugar transporter subunit IIA [Winslowiella arboricola]MCU5776589.1 PTS sugar transporter subunit IIA [Winslowiella arboricola]